MLHTKKNDLLGKTYKKVVHISCPKKRPKDSNSQYFYQSLSLLLLNFHFATRYRGRKVKKDIIWALKELMQEWKMT